VHLVPQGWVLAVMCQFGVQEGLESEGLNVFCVSGGFFKMDMDELSGESGLRAGG
jgi:hypothetical protein